ncbi:unnamed protein product [Linum tenue]|uniref:Uncharacterized protein n=1 Tax=Linum tenue TaxID=586396 RepID=A0AAV0MZQ2_9ROSI|nr:unnamed protein product [Linum tenue]
MSVMFLHRNATEYFGPWCSFVCPLTGGGCGVGLGLGWGFGSAFGSHYRSSRLTFHGVEFGKKDEPSNSKSNANAPSSKQLQKHTSS